MLAVTKRGFDVGMIGIGLFTASWAAVGLGGKIVPPTVVPHLWTVVLFATLPASLILGTVGGEKGSRWWVLAHRPQSSERSVLLVEFGRLRIRCTWLYV